LSATREARNPAEEEPTMSLSTTLDQFKKAVRGSRAERTYALARPSYEALAPYETVGGAVRATARGSGLSAADREAILVAIVTELQHSPEPLWPSLLLVAFTPMLVRVRAALRDPGNEDLDQSVLLAFLDAARSPVCRAYVARNLRLITQERLFAERRREHCAPEAVVFDEETHACDPFGVEARPRTAAGDVIRIIDAEGGEELRALIRGTYGDDRSVREYVDRVYAGRDARVRASACERLQRLRNVAFAKLRVRDERSARFLARVA
jgi:hypothetical protein